MITDYSEATQYLFNRFPQYQKIGAGAYKPGLDGMQALAHWAGHPQEQFDSIHIAGTNGKGSVAHSLAAVLQTAGYKTGLYTSPHLLDFRERIKVNGQMISQEEVTEFVQQFAQNYDYQTPPSFFEITTALAFRHFARQHVDIAVIETGLGGLLDSTNILPPSRTHLCVITNIGLEHCAMLGDTIAQIASQKAGIIKPGVPVVIGEYHPQSLPVFAAKAQSVGAPLFKAWEMAQAATSPMPLGDTPDLAGCYQEVNRKTERAALQVLMAHGFHISQEDCEEGLLHAAHLTGLHGRWECLGRQPLIMVDTAHNAHGLRYLPQQLAAVSYEKLYIIFGVVQDKDLTLEWPFLPKDAHYLFSQAHIERALPATTLQQKAQDAGLHGNSTASVQEAFAQAKAQATPRDMILVTGSTFVVAEVLEGLQK